MERNDGEGKDIHFWAVLAGGGSGGAGGGVVGQVKGYNAGLAPS